MNPLQPFLAFDQKAVDFLESLCHKQQRLLGTSHYFWLKIFAAGHVAGMFALVPFLSPIGYFIFGIIIAICTASIPFYVWWEKKSLARLARGKANPLRILVGAIVFRSWAGYFVTTVFVYTALSNFLRGGFWWVSILMVVWWVTLVSLFILPACDPLPPTTGKVRQWLASLFMRRVVA